MHNKALSILILLACVAGTAPAETPQNGLSLSEALARALEGNPALAAYPWDIRMAEARKLQAGVRLNPEISLEIEGLRWTPGASEITKDGGITEIAEGAGSGLSESEFTLVLSQVIELGGKRARRIRLAKQGIDVARWDYEVARADVLADTARAFGECLAAQQGAALSEALLHFAGKTRDITAAQVEAGQLSPLGLRKANLEVTAAQIDHQHMLGALEAARAKLAAAWGAETPDFTQLLGDFDRLRPVPELAGLRDQINDNPDVARWVAEMALRDAEVGLARAQRKPDVEVALGLKAEKIGDHWTRSHDGFTTTEVISRPERDWNTSLVLEVAIPLPIFDRNQGGIQEAHYAVHKSAAMRRATRAGVLASLAEHHLMLSTTAEEIQALETYAIPEATETFHLTQEGFKQGKFDYLDVLDAQRTLFDLQVQLLTAKTAYHQRWIEIDRLIGAFDAKDAAAGDKQ